MKSNTTQTETPTGSKFGDSFNLRTATDPGGTLQKFGEKRDVAAMLGLCCKRRLKSKTSGARKVRCLPAGVIELLGLWVLHACDPKMFVLVLYLKITSATKHSGKTTWFEILAGLIGWRLATQCMGNWP